ncbi:hypothetical protein [Breoghania sp. L-A4]|uniref:hypothetical protein n=1 Tax=Breoghania sp. L-A4 TaxID=2304600 RepID=UPI0013C2BC21|nr:hypothetical protein [Breoghania sp. L-A4]
MFKMLLGRAVWLCMEQSGNVLRISGIWILLTVLLRIADQSVGLTLDNYSSVLGESPAVALALVLGGTALMGAAHASIGVAWSRLALFDEQPLTYLPRLGAREILYALNGLKIGLIYLGAVLLIGNLYSILKTFLPEALLENAPDAVTDGALAVVAALAIAAVSSLALILPAVSVDRPISLDEAMRLSKGLFGPCLSRSPW